MRVSTDLYLKKCINSYVWSSMGYEMNQIINSLFIPIGTVKHRIFQLCISYLLREIRKMGKTVQFDLDEVFLIAPVANSLC